MSRSAANGLVFGLSVLVPTLVCSAPDAALDVRNPTRELQQLRRDVDRERAREDLRKMQEQREKLREERSDVKTEGKTSYFHFRLNGVEHNPSEVLTDEEIDEAVAPFLGREVSMTDVKNMLAAINARYREKGYVVCEARLRPQRIRAGHLFVTLIVGKTGAVTVTGNEHTRDGYVLGAFDLEKGRVANYRDMSADLVHFNMTNDVELRIDIRAGEAPGTTDYEITTHEPPNWTATVFADTTGARSTGRPASERA